MGLNCLGLKNLAMSEICHFVPVDSVQPELFTRLEALELWALTGVQLPALVVKQLTTPCQLIQNLLFRNCDVLTDQLLIQLWAVSRAFPHHLTIRIQQLEKDSLVVCQGMATER